MHSFAGRIPVSRALTVGGFVGLLGAYITLVIALAAILIYLLSPASLVWLLLLGFLWFTGYLFCMPLVLARPNPTPLHTYLKRALQGRSMRTKFWVTFGGLVAAYLLIQVATGTGRKIRWDSPFTYASLAVVLFAAVFYAYCWAACLHFLIDLSIFCVRVARNWNRRPFEDWMEEDYEAARTPDTSFLGWPNPKDVSGPPVMWQVLEQKSQARADVGSLLGQLVVFLAGGALGVFAPALVASPLTQSNQIETGVSVFVAVIGITVVVRLAPLFEKRATAYRHEWTRLEKKPPDEADAQPSGQPSTLSRSPTARLRRLFGREHRRQE